MLEMPRIYRALALLTLPIFLNACEDFEQLLEPQIIPTKAPIPQTSTEEEEELLENSPPPQPTATENPEELPPHPAALDIKELWKSTSEKITEDLKNREALDLEYRLATAQDLRNKWWQLNKKLLQDRNVDFSTIKKYSPLIDSIISGIDTIYSVNTSEYSPTEAAMAETEHRMLTNQVERLR